MSAPDPFEVLMRSMCEGSSPGLSLAYKVEDFARLVHGDNLKFHGFTQICQLVNEGKEIPGFSKSDFNCRAFPKEKLSECLEAASSLLFKQCLPYFVETKSLHSRLAEMEAVAEKEEEESAVGSTLKLTEELAEAQRKIISLQEQVIQLKDEIRSAESSAVTKTVQRDLKNYSAVLAQNCAGSMAPRKIQQAVRKATSSPEVEDRSCNLMIFGLPEESGSMTVESSVRGVLDSLNEKPVLPKTLYLSHLTHALPCQDIVSLFEEEMRPQRARAGKQPIRTRYLGHMTGYQPIRDQYFLIRLVPCQLDSYRYPDIPFKYLYTCRLQCTGGGFVSKLICHCEKMLENIDENLIIRLLNTIRCMMKTNLQFTPDALKLRLRLLKRYYGDTVVEKIAQDQEAVKT
eukprot:sb/3465349/